MLAVKTLNRTEKIRLVCLTVVERRPGAVGELNNLAKYRPQAVDHSVIAWLVDHTKPNRDLDKRDATFKIEAMAVTETDEEGDGGGSPEG
ncbi:hypothetical protein VTK56DRAFT_6686 [Thermocarpiscus australiensis]